MAIKVLIVDDEQSIVDGLAEILESAGYQVVCASSGKEAIASASEFCPEVLLSDVLMPNMHGF